MTRSLDVLLIVCLFLVPVSLTGQDRQLPFDSTGKIFEIQKTSPYAKVWASDIPLFERLLAFEADTGVVIEIYQTVDGAPVRERLFVERLWFSAKQRELDSLMSFVETRGIPMSSEDLEDLQSDFTYGQTAYSAFHGLAVATAFESGATFFIVTGGSYFLISSIADQLALTRANVEAASYGHLTGLAQGYLGGLTLFSNAGDLDEDETSVKMILLSVSAGGIAHAVLSYDAMSRANVNPKTQYLRMVTERHSLVWGIGLGALALGKGGDSRIITAIALTLSLSSNFWSEQVFGLGSRNMSWGDALLTDEMLTPWYLSLVAAGSTFEISDPRGVGALLAGGGLGGYLLGLSVNEGRMGGLATVRRTRQLMYGGALLGLGIVVAAEAEAKGAWWIVTGTTWLGYFIGSSSGSRGEAASLDLQVMPEGILLGSLLKPNPARPQIQSFPVLQLSWCF